jgi:hypothetical protein
MPTSVSSATLSLLTLIYAPGERLARPSCDPSSASR